MKTPHLVHASQLTDVEELLEVGSEDFFVAAARASFERRLVEMREEACLEDAEDPYPAQ